MTSITPFRATDLLRIDDVNLDVLTENYYIGYYLQYMCEWPSLCFKTENAQGNCTGYMLGKAEGHGKEWHGHITAVTVGYDYRRLGIAGELVKHLEQSCENDKYNCYFMDLFVRTSNAMALNMYRGFGYEIFRRIPNYYGSGDEEDAFDMRKPLLRDVTRASLQGASDR